MAEIRKRRLGRTNVMVTEIGLGGIPLMRVEDFDEAAELINYALDQGINYIDTARAYKDSEEKFGQVLKDRRDEVFVATKTHAYDYDTAWEYLETSLKNLQTDYLDLYQAHWVCNNEELDKVLGPGGTLETLQKVKGLTREFELKDSGMCGKMGQMVPTSIGGPYMFVAELTVGGQRVGEEG